MKVLSMMQPWASLFVLRESTYETRTWKTNYRGLLAIHTSMKKDKTVSYNTIIKALLQRHGYTIETLPTSMIIGEGQLVNCLKVTEDNKTWAILEDGKLVTGNDYLLGDFRVGNYAWEFCDLKQLKEFIPAKGKLGIWEFPKE